MSIDGFPLALQQAIESGDCILFVGAGIGANLIDASGKSAPMARDLAQEMAEHFGIETDGNHSLASIAEVVEIQHKRPNLISFVRRRLSGLQPDESVKWLATQRWKAIYTTNYDQCIEKAYELTSSPPQNPVVISYNSEIVPYNVSVQVPIVHIHGTLFGVEEPDIVITESDYLRFRERRRMLYEMLKLHSATSTVLYLGYSNSDPNWKLVLNELTEDYLPSRTPPAFRVAPQTNALEITILKSRNIDSLSMSTQEFVAIASAKLKAVTMEVGRFEHSRRLLPSDLHAAFDKNPASVLRLCDAWDYVRQSNFTARPNTHDFLRGDRPNWSAVASNTQFERDIEASVLEHILDYLVGDTEGPRTCIVLGSAGYGVTTLLMALSVKLIDDGATGVFFLKLGRDLTVGDIEYATALFPERPVFFVDDAAEQSGSLYALNTRLREMGRTALFVVGERTNEWRERNSRVRGKEFEILPLSDGEIDRLLDCLRRNGGLGLLQDLDRQLQFDAIKSKHQKQMLVAMREATEGRSFDAIVEDEFRGIENELASRFYLYVCFLYKFGILVRDELIAELLEVDLVDLYKATQNWTQGVVVYECIDLERGRYAARARHRVIAEIVWDRCSGPLNRENMPKHVLGRLNLNYSADKEAFEALIQSDELVDSIGSLEKRTEYFETACKKDPNSPYVRQHYARMLSRAKIYHLALEQIELGIKLRSAARVLYHTKGVILRRMAIDQPSITLARKRLVQSESCFAEAIRRYDKDEYAWHGLAELYFEWAKRCDSEEEASEYIAKAEETIENALRRVHRRDHLLVMSAAINDYLGDRPGAVAALEDAVSSHPEGIVARYLLGRRYRRESRPADALIVLQPIIHTHFDEFRSFIEYCMAMIDLEFGYAQVAAVLQLSTRYGMRDARYIAMLGGVLFMDGKFSEAEEVFTTGQNQGFPAAEERAINFRPPNRLDPSQPLRFEGEIVSVKTGFSFIDVENYPRFYFASSKLESVALFKGMKVTFEPGFNIRGPVADKVLTAT